MRVDSQELPLSAIPLCQLLPCHLGPPRPLLSRSSMPSCASSSLDLMMTVSCSLTLQICLIIALSLSCRRWRLGFISGQVSLALSIVLRTQELYTWPSVLKVRWQEERTGSSSRRFSHMLWLKVHSHRLLRACLLGSKRKLPPPAYQVRLGLPSVVCHPRGMQFHGTVYICNQGPLSSTEDAVAAHSSASEDT